MDAFEEMRENLRLTIAIQAERAKEIAELRAEEEKRQEKRNAELAELGAQNERERIELRQSLKSIGQKLDSIGMNNGNFAEVLFYSKIL